MTYIVFWVNMSFMDNIQNSNDKLATKKITKRSEDYSAWYTDVIDAAQLAEHSPVKGCMIIRPNGYALWESVQQFLDNKIKETGVENAYFPMFIPEKLLRRESDHVEGFSPELAVVTNAGGKTLEEPLVVRPTSETIMYEVFSNWIHSYRDLPLLINQWANVVRWEMRTRLFIRTTEFLWQEGHTVHTTEKEADDRARMMLEIYRDFAENFMAIPVIPGVKSESEKFAGALRTYTVEAMMQDGKALQFATSHNLGQNFSKPFDVKFLDENERTQYGWQTSWGLSTRVIGGLIMTHSDDSGLVLPPKLAPIQIVIIPVGQGNEAFSKVSDKASEIQNILKGQNFRVKLDQRDNLRPGEKFFEWEKRGVPIRIEIGPKDLSANKVVFVRRDTGEKMDIQMEEISSVAKTLSDQIQNNLFSRALEYQKQKTRVVNNWDEFRQAIEDGCFALAHWCGDKDVEAEIKNETSATIRCIPFSQIEEEGKCVKTGKPSKGRVIFAKSY